LTARSICRATTPIRNTEPTYWQQRRAAALINDVWNRKSATYVTVLTLFAVALFLFGIAATIGGCAARL
jgi:hypothetical protein